MGPLISLIILIVLIWVIDWPSEPPWWFNLGLYTAMVVTFTYMMTRYGGRHS